MRHIKLYMAALLASLALIASACGTGAKAGDQSTPTLAYKALYEAVKKKDHEAIKKTLSKGTLEMMETYAGMQKKSLNEVVENGLTETTFAPKLPETRNEKITGDVAILEVKNEKTGQFEALPFAKEDGVWKLAIDTFFKGTMSPTGPTNKENPGQLPPGTPGPVGNGAGQEQAAPPGKPGLNDKPAPGMPGAISPGDSQPSAPAPPPAAPPAVKQDAPKSGASPEKPKGIKPPTR